MNLEEYLPANLRGPSTTITKVQAGLSGAGVYRVEAAGQAFVLKVASAEEPIEAWQKRTQILKSAADAGVAPRVVHVDATRRSVLSAFVVDRSFPALFGTPATRDAALALLGRTLRRVHDLPIPPHVTASDPRAFLAGIWTGPLAGVPLPGFVGDAVNAVLHTDPPAQDRAAVLSHNDVNPTNLVYDGEHILLVDWDTAGVNDPLYDLAAAAVFLRMDEATCIQLLAAHDDAPVATLPPRFAWNRRVVAVLCGVVFLHLARLKGHTGAGDVTLESAQSMLDVYKQMRAGTLNVASAEGQWTFGLALVKAGMVG